MEIVITSLRPLELVAGKIMGLTLLSLTQFAIWTVGGILALFLAFSDQIDLQGLVIPWGSLLWGVLLIVPGYFLYAILAAGLGIIAGDAQQAQQLAGIMSFLGLAPIYILAPVLTNPDGPLAVGLTLFPLTSPSVTLLRTVFTQVPAWQMIGALAILLGSLALSVWVTTRLFRAAMLNYGKALRPRDLWQALVRA
jgi:ABC-2 type transport system permease protein